MKVAFILPQFPAISETFILNQITGLMDRGVEVDIFADIRTPQPGRHPALTKYELMNRTRYAVEQPSGRWAARLRASGLLGGALMRVPLQKTSLANLIRNGRTDAHRALRFTTTPRRLGSYDIIHCHFGPTGQWGMSLRNLGLLDGRLVTTFHGYDMCRPFREEGPDVYDRLFEEGDLFLPISDFWKRKLIEHGCPPEKILVHRMGVDCGKFEFRPRAIEPGEPIRLLSVSRLVEKKGLSYALRAVARVNDHLASSRARENGSHGSAGRRIEYTIVGSGPLRSRLERLVRELGLGESVRFAGARTSDEVARFMERSHILLAPSVTAEDGNREGIPVVLMEAMATGLPVISTHHSGIPELAEDGVTGLLAEERDIDGLVDGIRSLIDDPELYERLVSEGRERVDAEFDIEMLNERLLEYFRGLAEGKVASAAESPVPAA
jgi:colanic acid/amylovoran biosynthesis glycosyltransferase